MPNLEGLKAGDIVYVVEQARSFRGGTSTGAKGLRKVEKVGRKLGYLKRWGRIVPFRLSDGESHHPDPSDCNARANGFGFDVWPSKEAYEESQRIESERKRLSGRMLDDRPFRSGLRDFPHEVIQALHAVLDAAGQP